MSAEVPPFRCEMAHCSTTVTPVCFLHISEKCVGNKTSQQWHHMSAGEHFCHECFMSLSIIKEAILSPTLLHKSKWHKSWLTHASMLSTAPLIKEYIAHHHLPLWLKCRDCQQWRLIPGTSDSAPKLTDTFSCQQRKTLSTVQTSCEYPEDERVQHALADVVAFLEEVHYDIYLRSSPAHAFLANYHLDVVGIAPCAALSESHLPSTGNGSEFSIVSPRDVMMMRENRVFGHVQAAEVVAQSPDVPVYFHPFIMPNEYPKMGSISPTVMSPLELKEFVHYQKHSRLFLGVRNALIALWYSSPNHWLTPQLAASHMDLFGLIRPVVVEHLIPQLLRFLTFTGQINVGALAMQMDSQLHRALLASPTPAPGKHAVVIGAGLAGIIAARHLATFGWRVTVLEAEASIGGRLRSVTVPLKTKKKPSKQLSLPVGPNIIDHCVNCPLTLLAHQCRMKCQQAADNCHVIASGGNLIPLTTNVRVDFHVQAILKHLANLRRPLLSGDQLQQLQVLEESNFASFQHEFDKKEESILKNISDFSGKNKVVRSIIENHLAQLEFIMSGGIHLNNVSWSDWLHPFCPEQNDLENATSMALPHPPLPSGMALEPQLSGCMNSTDDSPAPTSWHSLLMQMLPSNHHQHCSSAERDRKPPNAMDLTVHLHSKVTEIRHNLNESSFALSVKTDNAHYEAHAVLLAVPLYSLEGIQFSPSLDANRQASLARLSRVQSDNVHLTVTMLFRARFWDSLLNKMTRVTSPPTSGSLSPHSSVLGSHQSRCFTLVPEGRSTRGFCFFFYDYAMEAGEPNVLQARIVGESAQQCSQLEDETVLLQVLRQLHTACYVDAVKENEAEVHLLHKPIWSHVGRWRQSCTMQPVASRSDDWCTLTQPMFHDTLHFTMPDFQHYFAASLSAAYGSGMRAAQRLMRAMH